MRKSVFYRLKIFTLGRLPSADVSSLSISYKVMDLYLLYNDTHDMHMYTAFLGIWATVLSSKINPYTRNAVYVHFMSALGYLDLG